MTHTSRTDCTDSTNSSPPYPKMLIYVYCMSHGVTWSICHCQQNAVASITVLRFFSECRENFTYSAPLQQPQSDENLACCQTDLAQTKTQWKSDSHKASTNTYTRRAQSQSNAALSTLQFNFASSAHYAECCLPSAVWFFFFFSCSTLLAATCYSLFTHPKYLYNENTQSWRSEWFVCAIDAWFFSFRWGHAAVRNHNMLSAHTTQNNAAQISPRDAVQRKHTKYDFSVWVSCICNVFAEKTVIERWTQYMRSRWVSGVWHAP